MKPTLFKDGDLVIVTPDVPGAVVSVKTELSGPQAWNQAALDLANIGKHCQRIANTIPWLGLYSYEGDETQAKNALSAICQAHRETKVPLNCVACGKNHFIRYWPKGQREPGDNAADAKRLFWRLYYLENLAPAYFVGNLVDAICNVDKMDTDYAWFAYLEGKRPYMIQEQPVEECM